MKRNVKKVRIRLTHVYNNPTFERLFGRKDELKSGEWFEMNVNHYHYSDLQRWMLTFKFEMEEVK